MLVHIQQCLNRKFHLLVYQIYAANTTSFPLFQSVTGAYSLVETFQSYGSMAFQETGHLFDAHRAFLNGSHRVFSLGNYVFRNSCRKWRINFNCSTQCGSSSVWPQILLANLFWYLTALNENLPFWVSVVFTSSMSSRECPSTSGDLLISQ